MKRSPDHSPWKLPDCQKDTFTLRQMGEDHGDQGGGRRSKKGLRIAGMGEPGFLEAEGLEQGLWWAVKDRTQRRENHQGQTDK